jgi:hypothetical protein
VDPPNAQLAKQKTSLYNFRQVGKTLSWLGKHRADNRADLVLHAAVWDSARGWAQVYFAGSLDLYGDIHKQYAFRTLLYVARMRPTHERVLRHRGRSQTEMCTRRIPHLTQVTIRSHGGRAAVGEASKSVALSY